eukprot:1435570-Prymnesium_polylepis.1
MASTCSSPVTGLNRVTMGSARKLAPHLGSSPRPRTPVRPRGLWGTRGRDESTGASKEDSRRRPETPSGDGLPLTGRVDG